MLEVSNFSASILKPASFVIDDLMAAAEPSQPIQKILYSRKDASFALSISQRSLDHLVANKRIEFRKMGSKIMFTHAALMKFSRQDCPSLCQ